MVLDLVVMDDLLRCRPVFLQLLEEMADRQWFHQSDLDPVVTAGPLWVRPVFLQFLEEMGDRLWFHQPDLDPVVTDDHLWCHRLRRLVVHPMVR